MISFMIKQLTGMLLPALITSFLMTQKRGMIQHVLNEYATLQIDMDSHNCMIKILKRGDM